MKTAELISDRFVYELLCEEAKPKFEQFFKYLDGDPASIIMTGIGEFTDTVSPSKESVHCTPHNAAELGLVLGYFLGRMKDDQRVKFMMKTLLEDGSNMASNPDEKMQ